VPGDLLPGGILFLTWGANPSVDDYRTASAILMMRGGLLSHVAIMCRELHKPCVAGVATNLPAGTFVRVDGSTGSVDVIGLRAT
jgi:phosphohistidine swiveling domain-containing protein